MNVFDLRYDDGKLRRIRSEDGEKVVERVEPDVNPYCYVEEGDFDMDLALYHNLSVAEGSPEGYIKLEGRRPSDVRDFSDDALCETYEADVSLSVRNMIDADYELEMPEPSDMLYFDIEVDDRGDFASPDSAHNRIVSIAAVGGDGEELYVDNSHERELFKDFLRFADDYSILVGWNSIGYDFKYLENRAPKVNLDVDWGRWCRTDLMPLYDMLGVPTKTVSTNLDDTAVRELGIGKTGVEAGNGTIYQLWDEDPEKLRQYNIRDTELVKQIDKKFDLVKLLYVVCDLCGYPPGEACYESKHGRVRFAIGQVVDAKILDTARRMGVPQVERGSFEKPDNFPGGYVLEPEAGMYESIVAPDYSGMYPNIIRAFNFGRETWYPSAPEMYAEHGTDTRYIEAETGVFIHPEDGQRSVPAKAADELVEMREDSADIVDNGVKAVNNTLYGVFASDYHRYFGPHSENITLIGQELTGIVEDLADGDGAVKGVVYGDTDSVMLDMGDPDDPIETAKEIAARLEEEMQAWAEERGAFAKYLQLDVDDVYDRYYISDKKKRYFGHKIYDGEPCDDFKVRGFEVRQNDWPEPVRNFQEELMHALLDDEPTGPIVDEYRERFFSGEWDSEMADSTTLTKPIDEYATPLPHTRAAEQIRERFGDGAIRVGDKVTYIKYGPDKHHVTWVHDGETGRELRPRDYSYLWKKKFESVMESIGVTRMEQTGLGDYA